MKVLQINAVYKKSSTGRNTSEMHEYMTENNIDSYVASPELYGLTWHAYKIGNKLDRKIHAFLSRLLGLQGYFSTLSTLKLIKYIHTIKPDIIHLGNLHSNYINLKNLLKYASKKDIAVVITLHDTWFYTGKCCHYLEDNCYKWQTECGNCPAQKRHNKSWFFDRSKKMYRDKLKLFSSIPRLGVIGVSSWTTSDAMKSSILKNALLCRTIYNWIDLEIFKLTDCNKAKMDLKYENKFIVLGVSQSWLKIKGVNIFIELSKLLPEDSIIIMIGRPNGYESNDKIKFLGETNNIQELVDYYNAADVFLNPSEQETFGKTTAEALSCGTPVIALNTTASPELVGNDEKCGFIVDENKASLYFEKINIIREKGKKHFSDCCRKRAEKMFNKEKNINQYIKLYEELINMRQ